MSNSKFIKDVGWNIVGYVIPILVSLPMLGILARTLGVERFGVFMLLLTIFGYAGIFDLGLSRAVVRSIAQTNQNKIAINEYVNSACSIVLPIAVVFSFIFYVLSYHIVGLISVSDSNKLEVVLAFKAMSFAFLPLLLFSVVQGYLEGLEKFKEQAILKAKVNIALAALPVTLTLYENTLVFAVYGLVIARAYALLAVSYIFIKDGCQINHRLIKYNRVSELLNYGKWLVLTNIISPILNTVDRFVLSSISGADKVALYTAPSEIVAKLLILPGLVMRTLFPKLAKGDGDNLRRYSYIFISIFMFITCTLLAFLSDIIIKFWLGNDYLEASTVLCVLSVGLFFCGIAQVPYLSVQARGYSRYASYIHVIEAIPYVIILYFLASRYSYIGAASAWSIRVFFDWLLFTVLDYKLRVNELNE